MPPTLHTRLTEAKRLAPADKEPFDIHRFGEFYDLNDDRGHLFITPALIEELEIKYYLLYPELRTLKELGDTCSRIESQGG